MGTIVQNIKILQDGAWCPSELAILEGKIVSDLGSDRAGAAEVVDGGGAFCFPGAVDLHVHFNEPGRTEWEGFATGSAAAAAGGITYLADMPLNCLSSTVTVSALEEKLAAIFGNSYTDFGLWGGVVPGNVTELLPLAEAGVMGFKSFMSPSGNDDFENSGTSTLRAAMQQIVQTGLRLALHAEDPHVLEKAAAQLTRKETAGDWLASRPIESELEAVRTAIELSVETSCPITIVHVSAPEVLQLIQAAKEQGVDILCETCPHYLLLSAYDAAEIGAYAKCAPPLRSEATRASLVEHLLRGRIDTVGSDHSPSPPELKAGKCFYDAWGGIAGVQHGLPLLLDRVGLEIAVHMDVLQKSFGRKPADTIGLDTKGRLEPGSDADFFLVQALHHKRLISPGDLLYRNPISAYIGMEQTLALTHTYLRGKPVVANGHLVGAPRGQFIKGEAFAG